MSLKTRLLKRVMIDYVLPGVFNRSIRRPGKAMAMAAGGVGLFLAGRAVIRRLNEYDLQGRTVLPAPGGIGAQRAQGFESESSLAPSPLTAMGDKAALRNNEFATSQE
jgi:hypothetical protein